MFASLSFTKDFALSKTFAGKPNFLLIANALLFPGTPIKSLYVGRKSSTSKSELAFSKPVCVKAYYLSS